MIPAVKTYCKVHHLLHRKGSTLNIIGFARYTVSTVVYTVISQKNFKQRHTPTVFRIGVANPRCVTVAQTAFILTVSPAGRTGNIILGSVCKYLQLFLNALKIHIIMLNDTYKNSK